MSNDGRAQGFSKIKEVVAAWNQVRQRLRSGDEGYIVPVVIPKDRRGFGWLFLAAFSVYFLLTGIIALAPPSSNMLIGIPLLLFALLLLAITGAVWWNGSIVEIEQGTTGIVSSYGKIVNKFEPGRHYLRWPWQKVEFIVDTSTEIPYTAPVLACPTRENVPLKSIEFFLKFRIVDPVAFVRRIGASNFDAVLSSMVQDAIRQRSRMVQTERAYDLRGSDVDDMQAMLNRQMQTYGAQIIGANIPDVQLPDQYQQHLATRERVAKELAAYEREWELTRRQRTDSAQMEIERAKKVRDARLVEVNTARNEAREKVAQVLQQQETEAQKVRWEIEAHGRAMLKSAENEAKALRHLGKSYKDNWAVVQYELAKQRLNVAEHVVSHAPRPILVQSDGGDQSALSTLLLAQVLPGMLNTSAGTSKSPGTSSSSNGGDLEPPLMQQLLNNESKRREGT
jgi:regulator of protease activity HflC (stomatin/prohibitin superfamily)